MSALTAALVLCITALSIITTKCVLNTEFHFPMHLLSMHVVGTIFVRLITSVSSLNVSLRDCRSRGTLSPLPLHDDTRDDSDIRARILYSACIGGALAATYQAIHHHHSPTTVVMILSIEIPFRMTPRANMEASIIQMHSSIQEYIRRSFLCAGLALVLICDFRISSTGVAMVLLATVLVRLGAITSAHVKNGEQGVSMSTYGLIGAIATSAFWCRFREQQYSTYFLNAKIIANFSLLCVNFALTVASLSIGRYLILRHECSEYIGVEWLRRHPRRRLMVSVSLVVITHASSCMVQTLPPRISIAQWLGFLSALMGDFAGRCMDETQQRVVEREQPEAGVRQLLDCVTLAKREFMVSLDEHPSEGSAESNCAARTIPARSLLVLFVFMVLTGIFYAFPFGRTVNKFPIPHPGRERYHSALEIVIARYDEPATKVAKHIMEVLSLVNIRKLKPSVTIYNKGAPDILSGLKELLSLSEVPVWELKVQQLPNIGRETDTYLEHITSRWESLANHTIFMQADVHNSRALTRHIRDYFVPSTGFLSLAGWGGHCATCDRCFDRDWTEDPDLLSRIFSDFNPGQCRDIVLTYRGQFVVSAARIRRNPRELYSRWLQKLRDPGGEFHTQPYTDSVWSRKEDSLSAPRVGFTLERTWGVMFQCNSKRISERCPSLLSSFVCPPRLCGKGSIEDCQCLDTLA